MNVNTAAKPMTAEEQAILIKRIARMAGRHRGFGLWSKLLNWTQPTDPNE